MEISQDQISAEAQRAFSPTDFFMPFVPWESLDCNGYSASVSPQNIFTSRKDIRVSQVQRIIGYYLAHGEMPAKKHIYVNKVSGSYQISQDGNHRTIAARLTALETHAG